MTNRLRPLHTWVEDHLSAIQRHHPKPAPADIRPYRAQHEPGQEQITTTTHHDVTSRQVWRQVGWHGQTGALYALDEDPSKHEPGSFSPLWLLVDNEPIPQDEDHG